MNTRITILVAAGSLLAALTTAGLLANTIQKQRDDLQLVVTMQGTEGMPPHVAVVTAALGTFRGLAVDLLWARADHLQMQGEFYEAQTLSQWITTLQPRFQKVWSFQAWNLAWNITAATQVPAERWGWVCRGIDLLRGRGIPLNPRAANLYFELAWIFENKIGRVGDKEHWYYKARLAAEFQEVLGEMVGGRTTRQAIERFRKIVEAPATLEELRRQTPEIARILELLKAHDLEPDESFLRMLGRVMMRLSSLDAKVHGDLPLPRGTNLKFIQLLQDERELANLVFEKLIPHLQHRVLLDRYHMEPAVMADIMERYGPLDWRHPNAHGIYWSEKGVSIARTLSKRDDVNELMLIRSQLLMLLNLMRSGRVEYDPVSRQIDLLPDPRFARSFEGAIESAFALIESEQGVAAADFGLAEEQDLFAAYEKFLNLATILSYLYGDQVEAERYFMLLKDLVARQGYGDQPAFTGTLENFVAIRFAGMVEVNVDDLRQLIDAMIRRALLEGAAKGNPAVFARFLKLARSVYDRRYAANLKGQAFVLDEAKLLAFAKLLDNSFVNVMTQNSLSVFTRARVWSWVPEELRERNYQALVEDLGKAAKSASLDRDRAFPPPSSDSGESLSGTDLKVLAVESDDGDPP